MKGLKTKRVVWTVVFLGITLAAIVMEVIAGIWHPAGTIPWTEYIATYVPWPVQLAAYVALAVWLPFHFWRHDHLRKAAYWEGRRSMQTSRKASLMTHLNVITDSELADEIARRGLTVGRDSSGNVVAMRSGDGH